MEGNQELADLVQRFREAAARQDPGWLQQQLQDLLGRDGEAPREARPTRRSRPPARLSPQQEEGPGRRRRRTSASPKGKKARTRGRTAGSGGGSSAAAEGAQADVAVPGVRQVCGKARPAAPRSVARRGGGGAASPRGTQEGEAVRPEHPQQEGATGLTREGAGGSAQHRTGPGPSTGPGQDGREAAPGPPGSQGTTGASGTAQGQRPEPGASRRGSPTAQQGWEHDTGARGRRHNSRPDEARGSSQRGEDSSHGQGGRHNTRPRSRSRSVEHRHRGSQERRHSLARSRRRDSMARTEASGARDRRRASRSRSRCGSHRHSCCRFSCRSSPSGSERRSRARSTTRDDRPYGSHSGNQGTRRSIPTQRRHQAERDQVASTVTAQGAAASTGPGGEQGTTPRGQNRTLLDGLRQLLESWEGGTMEQNAARAWVAKQGATVQGSAAAEQGAGARAGTNTAPVVQSGEGAAGRRPELTPGEPEEGKKEREAEREAIVSGVADAARQNAYVSFAGPLGVHIKAETKEKIWKGEFVELFSLLPLDEVIELKEEDKKDSKKEEEEKKKKYRRLPKTFGNWLRAFCILASIIGEKSPEKCSSLFCYVDGIWEAFRVYGGLAWWRYDEQFRQRLAANPTMRWDQMDITLWLRLMMAQRSTPFPKGAGGQGSTSAPFKPGYCWLFNDSQCRWGTSCKYKHECSGCGGAHSYSKCFKRGKSTGKQGDAAKGEDTSEVRRDATMARPLR